MGRTLLWKVMTTGRSLLPRSIVGSVRPVEGLLSYTGAERLEFGSWSDLGSVGYSVPTTPTAGVRGASSWLRDKYVKPRPYTSGVDGESSPTVRTALVAGKSPQRHYSEAAISMDSRLFGEPCEEDHRNLAGRIRGFTASAGSLDIDHTNERPHTGLSEAARRENLKKERYELKFERAREGARTASKSQQHKGACNDSLDACDSEDINIQKPDEFMKDVMEVESIMDDLGKSLRMEHLTSGGQEERARRERELRRKELEEAQRRARKKEQEARDPHRKVQLRLENERRFRDEESDRLSIPMSKIKVQGQSGRKQVALVDVRQIQSRCLFLDEGTHNVGEMLCSQKRNEKQRRRAALSTSMKFSSSAPSLYGPTSSHSPEANHQPGLQLC